VIALYSLALLVSAALLFLLEPMVGKFVLPLLGSAPGVWPTTVLFFQAALLAGYGFAHVTTRLSPRRQALLQLVRWALQPSCCRSRSERKVLELQDLLGHPTGVGSAHRFEATGVALRVA
jgi:Ni/Fe-hydrogenase subunit HybB-like protein